MKEAKFGPGPKWSLSGKKDMDEIHANYVVQYLKPVERKRFVNEAYRALKKGGKLVIVAPHWCTAKAFADLDAHFPPVSENWFQFLNKAWREAQNWPIKGYNCDFEFTLGYGMHPAIASRNAEYQQHALAFFRESAQDIHCTLTKR